MSSKGGRSAATAESYGDPSPIEAKPPRRSQLPPRPYRRVVERDDRAFGARPELAQRRDQLLLEPGVGDRHLLGLDHEADLADGQLDHLLEQGYVLASARVEAAQLGGRVISDQALAVCGALERVVVDDDQPAVGGEVDVAFDEVAPGIDGGAKRSHRVFGMLRGIASVSAEERAAVVVNGLVTGSRGWAHGSEQSNRDGMFFPPLVDGGPLVYTADDCRHRQNPWRPSILGPCAQERQQG